MPDLTSNQHYGAINRRFEKRSKLLRRFGYKYTVVQGEAIAFFARTVYGKRQTVTVDFLMLADKRTWGEMLSRLLNRY